MIAVTNKWCIAAIFCCAILLGGALLFTSWEVRTAQQDLKKLDHNISKHNENSAVQKAEWAHLNRPQRLETLKQQHIMTQQSEQNETVKHHNDGEGI